MAAQKFAATRGCARREAARRAAARTVRSSRWPRSRRSTNGMPMAAAAIRTHFFRQIAATRIVRRGRFALDADNPVMPRIER